MSFPFTMNTKISAEFVAWSPTRSSYFPIDCTRAAR
jgi:hypothetical protein